MNTCMNPKEMYALSHTHIHTHAYTHTEKLNNIENIEDKFDKEMGMSP